MRYIDSGNRSPSEVLGTWLQAEPPSGIAEFRWQSGFFSRDGLGPLVALLQHMSTSNLPTRGVIGSNDGETLLAHAEVLVSLLGLPRSNAALGVVGYAGAYYHPKTYHFRRTDGSQAAYVGSANLTMSGMARHVEAGILLDTRDGDPSNVLDDVAGGVDAWFGATRPGFESVADSSDLTRLLALGMLATAPPPRAVSTAAGGTSGGAARPGLSPVASFAGVPGAATAPAGATTPGSAPIAASPPAPSSVSPTVLSSAPMSPFPGYILFAPGAALPTVGVNALTGSALPSAAPGLIVRLNRDSARHWRGGDGTANISIPVATIQTIRFGLFTRKYDRPRAEFPLEMRFLNQLTGDFRSSPASTNIMVYGHAPGESGHADTRFLVPKAPAAEVADFANANGLVSPDDGDCALLEWPIPSRPSFRLSLLERSSPLHAQAAAALASAASSGAIVGQGACWLPSGLSPAW